MSRTARTDGLRLFDLHGNDGGAAEAAGLRVKLYEGSSEVGTVRDEDGFRIGCVAARRRGSETAHLHGARVIAVVGEVRKTECRGLSIGTLGEDGAAAALRSYAPAFGEHHHGGAVLQAERTQRGGWSGRRGR